MIESYVYWIAAGDRAHGAADARRVQALRAAWRAHRVGDAVSPFDGAAFWLQDATPRARIVRTISADDGTHVEVLDIDPALV
jgi:hypothetical protein